MPPCLSVTDLGRLAYSPALDIQRQTHERVLAGGPNTLLLVEHEPVITIPDKASARAHLLAGPARLAALGIDVQPTDRGGDITYHGPGQLVAYPILRLDDYGLNLGRYMRLLERVVLDTLAALGIEGRREQGATGVWVELGRESVSQPPAPPGGSASVHLALQHRKNPPAEPGAEGGRAPGASAASPGAAKICALGIRVRRGVTLHGLALNVATDLSHFDTIVPCGLAGRTVTSVQRLLGTRCPLVKEVQASLVEATDRLLRETSAWVSGAPGRD